VVGLRGDGSYLRLYGDLLVVSRPFSCQVDVVVQVSEVPSVSRIVR